MNWLTRLFLAPVYRVAIPSAPDHAEEILTHLLEAYPAISPYDPPAIQGWYENVAFWLTQLPTLRRDAWVEVLTSAMRVKYPDIPARLCISVLQFHVDKAKKSSQPLEAL